MKIYKAVCEEEHNGESHCLIASLNKADEKAYDKCEEADDYDKFVLERTGGEYGDQNIMYYFGEDELPEGATTLDTDWCRFTHIEPMV